MAWVTISDVKAELPELSGTGEDTVLTSLLARAESVLAGRCGYKPATATASPTFQSAAYTEYPEFWQVTDGGISLRLRHRPITAITTIHDSPDRSYGSNDLVDSGDYSIIDGELVVLDYDATHGAWSTYNRAIKAVYTAGWTTPPDDLKDALIDYTVHLFRLIDRRGRQSISVQGGSQNLRKDEIPDEILQKITPFILPVSL